MAQIAKGVETHLEVSLDVKDLGSAEGSEAEQGEERVPGDARVQRLWEGKREVSKKLRGKSECGAGERWKWGKRVREEEEGEEEGERDNVPEVSRWVTSRSR